MLTFPMMLPGYQDGAVNEVVKRNVVMCFYPNCMKYVALTFIPVLWVDSVMSGMGKNHLKSSWTPLSNEQANQKVGDSDPSLNLSE